MMQTHALSERRSCDLLNLSRVANRYQPKPSNDKVLADRLCSLAQTYPRYGYPKNNPGQRIIVANILFGPFPSRIRLLFSRSRGNIF